MDYNNMTFGVEPFLVDDEGIINHLRETYEFHRERTPHWRTIKSDPSFDGSLREVLESIFNTLEVNPSLLREEWPSFLPHGYRGRIRFYQSSGTTGRRKFAHWDESYVHVLVNFLREALDRTYSLGKLYEEEPPRALIHGPYGWYQEEMSHLIWSYGGMLYFVGAETEGLKQLLEREPERAYRLLEPLINYTKRVIMVDDINTVRTSPQMLDLFLRIRDDMRAIFLSGTALGHETVKRVKNEFENAKVIPLYGNFLFGDAVGIAGEDGIVYYPNAPFTLIVPLIKEDDVYRIAKYGERGKTGVIVARPELFVVMVEDEEVTRRKPRPPFRWDGFENPSRGT
ncbi:hypothetical protein [Palaeococcus ferrophilus]|uniref:hypothetical protein n=1 Tax=Palaeococcus ferrophilus TaxID=83868 RepID=UPI00064F943E|nr:hypothetical protein [Palaeococcus ferrophilus]